MCVHNNAVQAFQLLLLQVRVVLCSPSKGVQKGPKASPKRALKGAVKIGAALALDQKFRSRRVPDLALASKFALQPLPGIHSLALQLRVI